MLLTFLKSKIHRATVTQADLDYEGSISIDVSLMEAAGFHLHEQVDVLNITNGARFTTYTIEAARGSGTITVNGAAAHLVDPGDLVIICAYVQLEPQEVKNHTPVVILVDEQNRIKNG
jgi:aspartate 1-decarboxylase